MLRVRLARKAGPALASWLSVYSRPSFAAALIIPATARNRAIAYRWHMQPVHKLCGTGILLRMLSLSWSALVSCKTLDLPDEGQQLKVASSNSGKTDVA
jgi:hypothetical protein